MKANIYLFSISSHPDAHSINSLSVTFFKPEIDFSYYDYLIITSKQTSEALKQYETHKYVNKKALCISKQSALSYQKLGGDVLDIGGGYGDNLLCKIQEFSKETRWLYLRAEVVASDFVSLAQKQGYHIDEKVLYRSECSKEILEVTVESDAVLIFTSPSSLRCFLQTHTLTHSQKIIVIGKTTAKALPEGFECHISAQTTIQSCIELAKSL